MAAYSYNDVQNKCDDLVKKIINELNILFEKLISDKKYHEEQRVVLVHKFHEDQVVLVKNRNNEIEEKKIKTSHQFSDEQQKQADEIERLRVELDKLLLEDINFERRRGAIYNDDPDRIKHEIDIVSGLIKYVKENTRNIQNINARGIYDKLKNVNQSILIRREEENLTEKFELHQNKIRNQADEIIKLIDKLLNSIPEFQEAATSSVSPSPSQNGATQPTLKDVNKLEENIDSAEKVLEKESGWFMDANDNLTKISEIVNSNDQKKKSHCRPFIRRIRTDERREQWGASVNIIEGKCRAIIDDPLVPAGPRKEIKKSLIALKVWEGDALVTTTNGLVKELKKPEDQIDWNKVDKDVNKTIKDTQAIVAVDMNIKKNFGIIEDHFKLIKNQMQSRGIRPRTALGAGKGAIALPAGRTEIQNQRIARAKLKSQNRPNFKTAKEARIVENDKREFEKLRLEAEARLINPEKAKRTLRSKNTNLQGKNRGRRGFSSDAREPPSRPPKRQPYNRRRSKRATDREREEEGY